MDNIFTKFQPYEQARWNQANIDTLFYAGNQTFINRNFSFTAGISPQQYYFNLVQQPINMITGYQRQHRKSIVYQPTDGSDPFTTDQYTRVIKDCCQKSGINELFSKSCELAAIAGMNLMQPYLDFTGDDPAQGELKLKIWEYNSFIVDPFFRQPDMSDANFVWCQEYINKREAQQRFKDKAKNIRPMSGTPQRYGRFYFLPESYNMMNNDLMILSYIWYKSSTKRKRLYSETTNMFYDFGGDEDNLMMILQSIPDLEEVTVESPCWKVAIVLNDQLMEQSINPLWDGPECPFIPNFWNYDPHINQYDLRSRSLIFPLRSPQFLFNHKVITNNDIASATINAGWKRKVGAVANEDNLKKSGQGWDVLINPGFELTDCEKIIPSAVPESDIVLANQMSELIFSTSGINLENWSGQDSKQISSLTLLLKQAANLMVFQKYFDQWDFAFKTLGERFLQYIIKNWNAQKVAMILNEEPSPHFFSRVFAKFHTIVEEGILTPTQRNLQAQQMLDINSTFGREVIPASMIIKYMNIQGKGEIEQFLQQQEEQAAAVQSEATNIQHAFEEAKLKEMYTQAMANLATARERHGRAEADIGLFEERLSEITHNRAMATKAKMEALEKMVDVIAKFGEVETMIKMNQLDSIEDNQSLEEDREKQDAKQTAESNKFLEQLLGQMGQKGQQTTGNQMGQMPQGQGQEQMQESNM